MTEIQQLLANAAAYIERHGWTQNRVQDDAGAVCAVGALTYAQGYRGGFNAAVRLVEKRVRRPIVEWNNAPERTAQEVIDTFREVAGVTQVEQVEQQDIHRGALVA